jgi:hypothetical protein
MRGLTFVALIPCIVVLAACSPNPTFEGRKLSEWVKQLNDRDEGTQEAALNVIKKVGDPSDKVQVYPHEVVRARGPLTRLASDKSASPSARGKAAALLYEIFAVSPANYSVDDLFSLVGHKDYENFWHASAGKALASMRRNKDQILARAVAKLQDDPDETLSLDTIFAAFGNDALKVLHSISVPSDNYTLQFNISLAEDAAKCGERYPLCEIP